MPAEKLLIANRGEIAIRIIRAAKELGLKTVAVYSEADKDSLHVLLADEQICIGGPRSSESYLDMKQIISAAIISNCDLIHPGYGFLAENPDFAEMCQSHNIKLIGPTPEQIRSMGDKAKAKELMRRAGVPVIPGSRGAVADVDEGLEVAREVGFPVMIKAVAGGGGKGMRVAVDEGSFIKNFELASVEAKAAFGDPSLYIEKLIESPRHIEIQILGDEHNNLIHLGERECSIQRRHQKLIEESPSPAVTPEIRKKMGEAALLGAKKIGYQSAGTIEFLLDKNGNFYFMEMNTRIQVEHPVTEMVSGIDIVKEQIKIALGERLAYRQDDVVLRGHAIECRINAEDIYNNFAPCPGKIEFFHPPGGPGVRLDTHIYAQYVVPPYYDSLLGKLITHGRDRAEAIARARRALDEIIIEGVKNTIPLHKKIMSDKRFIAGDFDTHFLDNFKIED